VIGPVPLGMLLWRRGSTSGIRDSFPSHLRHTLAVTDANGVPSTVAARSSRGEERTPGDRHGDYHETPAARFAPSPGAPRSGTSPSGLAWSPPNHPCSLENASPLAIPSVAASKRAAKSTCATPPYVDPFGRLPRALARTSHRSRSASVLGGLSRHTSFPFAPGTRTRSPPR
jgi:hypothetical protein